MTYDQPVDKYFAEHTTGAVQLQLSKDPVARHEVLTFLVDYRLAPYTSGDTVDLEVRTSQLDIVRKLRGVENIVMQPSSE